MVTALLAVPFICIYSLFVAPALVDVVVVVVVFVGASNQATDRPNDQLTDRPTN